MASSSSLVAELLQQLLGQLPDAADHKQRLFIYKRYKLLVYCVYRHVPRRSKYEHWLQKGYHMLLLGCERCFPSQDKRHAFWYGVDHSRTLELTLRGLQFLCKERKARYAQGVYDGQAWLSVDSHYTAEQLGTEWQRPCGGVAAAIYRRDKLAPSCLQLEKRLDECSPRQLPTTQVDVMAQMHLQASGWSLDQVKRAFCEALRVDAIGSEATVSTAAALVSGSQSEYERVWQQRMQQHSPEGVYTERLQEIDRQRAQFASTHA